MKKRAQTTPVARRSGAGRERLGYAASITTANGVTRVLDYPFWRVNHRNDIGLPFENIQPAEVPLGSRVTFVKKAARNTGG